VSDNACVVTVVDDDPSVLKAVSRLLRSAGMTVSTFETPESFLESYDPSYSGCLVLDLTLPGLSGLELQKQLSEKGGAPPIVFLSGTGDIPDTVRAMKLGAVDFLTKPVDETALLSAVHAAMEKENKSRRERLELLEIRTRLEKLTPREREVFEQVVTGKLNKQIASELGTVEKTVKVHRARVMEKMGADSLADLVRTAQKLGIGGQ
jgi:FixJ family two-component response regulator